MKFGKEVAAPRSAALSFSLYFSSFRTCTGSSYALLPLRSSGKRQINSKPFSRSEFWFLSGFNWNYLCSHDSVNLFYGWKLNSVMRAILAHIVYIQNSKSHSTMYDAVYKTVTGMVIVWGLEIWRNRVGRGNIEGETNGTCVGKFWWGVILRGERYELCGKFWVRKKCEIFCSRGNFYVVGNF